MKYENERTDIMTATYSKKEIRDLLRNELKEYEKTFGDMTDEERQDLREWVREGNSVYSNPYIYSDGDGYPMDYITAIRFNDEMVDNPADFGIIDDKDAVGAADAADGMPF